MSAPVLELQSVTMQFGGKRMRHAAQDFLAADCVAWCDCSGNLMERPRRCLCQGQIQRAIVLCPNKRSTSPPARNTPHLPVRVCERKGPSLSANGHKGRTHRVIRPESRQRRE